MRSTAYPGSVTAIDWLIVAFTALLAFYGYMQGFIVGALSLLGFAIGAFVGARLGPLLLPGGSHSQYGPLFGLLGALLAGGVLASGFEGVAVRARSILRLPGLRTIDGLLGAALTACVGLGIAWIVGSVAIDTTGSPSLRDKLERSAILRRARPAATAVGSDSPRAGALRPAAGGQRAGRKRAGADPRDPRRGGVRAARASVVRVLGTACGLGIEGSGWVAAPGLVVTNAHVVAGENDTIVQPGGGRRTCRRRSSRSTPHDDIAVLRVPGLPRGR